MRWDTQLFTRLARCDRKEERCSYCLEVEGEPCHQGEGHLADVPQTLSSLPDTTCQARQSQLGGPCGGFSNIGKEMAAKAV